MSVNEAYERHIDSILPCIAFWRMSRNDELRTKYML